MHPCKKGEGKAFALVAREGQQMLKSFTLHEESKQKASRETASTNWKQKGETFY